MSYPISSHAPVFARASISDRLGDFFSSIAAGMRAAAELRRLRVMTDAQLAAADCARASIPDAVFERHFA